MAIKCNNCGATMLDTVNFCTECGTKLEKIEETISRCINCGSELKEGANFCVECGTPVESSVQSEESETNDSPIEMESNESKLDATQTDIETDAVSDNVTEEEFKADVIERIPENLDLSKSVIDVKYVFDKETCLNDMFFGMIDYNGKAHKHGYELFEYDEDTCTLSGNFAPNTSNKGGGLFSGFKKGWKEAEIQIDFLKFCKLCESIARSSSVKIQNL